MEHNYLADLQRQAIVAKLRGEDSARTSSRYVESDGRKRLRAMRDLVAAGYLAPRASGDGYDYSVTPAVYASIPAARPDLVVQLPAEEIARQLARHEVLPAVPWAKLSCGEQKWIIEHPADYRLGYVDPSWLQHWMPVSAPASALECAPRFRSELYVADDALAAHYADAAVRYWEAHYAVHGLPWALETLAHVPAHQAKMFAPSSERSPFDMSGIHMRTDPARWEHDLDDARDAIKEHIARLQDRLDLVNEVQAAVRALGGWDKFRADMQDGIRAIVRKGGGR